MKACGMNGGGGKHDGNHGKPGYMSHIPDGHLKTGVPEHKASSHMTLQNISNRMSKGASRDMAGGDEA